MSLKFNIHSVTPVEDGGGTTINNQDITITENGTYVAERGYTGLGEVEVDVSGSAVKRGNWTVPQAYVNMDEIISNSSTTQYTDCNTIYGIVFDNHNAQLTMTLGSYGVNALITSDGSTYIYDGVNNTSITHNWDTTKDIDGSYRYIILHGTGSMDTTGIYIDGEGLKKRSKYFVIKSTRTPSRSLTDWISSCSESDGCLESYMLIDTSTFMNQGWFFPSQEYFPKMKYIPSILELGNPSVTFTSLVTSNTQCVPNLPYGIDLSSVTSDIEIGRPAYDYYSTMFIAYCTLPNVNVTFKCNTYGDTLLTKDNWAYIAEHAPTVSSKTLSMGSKNVAICGGSSGSIITTLTGKGWIVSG